MEYKFYLLILALLVGAAVSQEVSTTSTQENKVINTSTSVSDANANSSMVTGAPSVDATQKK